MQGVPLKERLAALELYFKVIVIQESRKTVEEHKFDHGIVYLPELKPSVPKKGGYGLI